MLAGMMRARFSMITIAAATAFFVPTRTDAQRLPALRSVRAPAKMNGKEIDHVVVMMLENRSFDHFMGWLYDQNVRPKNFYPETPLDSRIPSKFIGLSSVDLMTLKNPFTIQDPDNESKVMHQGWMIPKKGARHAHIPSVNPHEDYIHIQEDMWNISHEKMKKRRDRNKLNLGPSNKAPMNGFVSNFGDAILHHTSQKHYSRELLSEIMDTYVPEQIPVLSGLARHFAVSDLWFCSVPSQTNANRAFWSAGTSMGLVTNNFYDAYLSKTYSGQHISSAMMGEGSNADALPDGTRTLFDVLEEQKISWDYYWESDWPPKATGGGQYFRTMFSQFKGSKYDKHFPRMSEFLARAEAGTLNAVTYVEPAWGGGGEWDAAARMVGHEFHPVGDTTVGEFFVKKVYDALRKSPKWEKTLFVITFDENGGTYDHVAPWLAYRPGRGGSPASHTHAENDPSTSSQFGYEFDTYGIRVPTILISPYVKPGTLFRSPTEVPFDHTSVIATILKWQGLDQEKVGLGNRVARAPTFDGVLQGDAARASADMARALRIDEIHTQTTHDVMPTKAIRYGEPVRLRYVGNKWPYDPTVRSANEYFLGKPTAWGGLYYATAAAAPKDAPPKVTAPPRQAVRITFDSSKAKDGALAAKEGPSGDFLTNGRRVKLTMVAADMPKPTVDIGYQLTAPDPAVKDLRASIATAALPSLNRLAPVALFLTKGDGYALRTDWRVWRVSSRVDGEAIYEGDEVFVFNERYAAENIETFLDLKMAADPFQRLALGPVMEKGSPRYLRVLPGQWDIWRIER